MTCQTLTCRPLTWRDRDLTEWTMALEKPPLATVEPGRPITAQGWNAIVDALSALYDAVLAFGSGNFAVSVQADGAVVDGVEIVAEPVGEGLPVEALPLFGSRTTYLVTGVSDGAWRVHVERRGVHAANSRCHGAGRRSGHGQPGARRHRRARPVRSAAARRAPP